MNIGRDLMATAGTQTAGLAMTGRDIPVTTRNVTEEYDGTSWSNANAAPTALNLAAGCGTQTAALLFGGNPGYKNSTFEYDGTNYSTGGNMGIGRNGLGGSGSQTSAFAVGGADTAPSVTAAVEGYNGTSWITNASLALARRRSHSAGTSQSNSIAFGGASPYTNSTEEFTAESTALNLKTITDS